MVKFLLVADSDIYKGEMALYFIFICLTIKWVFFCVFDLSIVWQVSYNTKNVDIHIYQT